MAKDLNKFDIDLELMETEESIGFEGNFRQDKIRVHGKKSKVASAISSIWKLIKAADSSETTENKTK